MKRAVENSAFRICAGFTSRPDCFAAESSSATEPATIGDAIEVPWIMSYPGGTSYGRTLPDSRFQAGQVDSSDPGATTCGFRPPSSRGPRDENAHNVSVFG